MSDIAHPIMMRMLDLWRCFVGWSGGNSMSGGNLLEDAEREREKKPMVERARLVFRTDHLQNYQMLDDIITLEGKDFTPLIKAAWYCILGILKPKFVQFVNIETDTRFNLFIPIPAGAGKGNIKQGISRIVSECGKKVRVPTSFHPEQLIGKIITERFHNPEKDVKGMNDVRFVPNYGYLKSDCLIFDEAYNFVTRDDKQYDESKTYIRIALDPIGRNLIQKKLIDHLDVPEQRLEYNPHCTVVMFLQPNYMDSGNSDTGFLRRFIIPYIPLVGKNLDRKDEMWKYLNTPRQEASFDWWRDIDEWDAPTYFEFEDGVNALLYKLHDDLIEYMRLVGEKHRQYLDRKAYAIYDDMVGMAAIQAMSRKSDVVTQRDVKLAYMDYFEFMLLTLDYVDAKISGRIDYGEEWQGAEAKEVEVLRWLMDSGATDEDKSEITIKDLRGHIANVFEIVDESARRHYSKLKKNGLIDSKRTGKNSSRVWITFDPDRATEVEVMPLSDTMYWKIAQDGCPPAHLHTCTTLETDNGSGELQVCNVPTDSGSAKNTESIADGAKNEAGDLQVCNAPIEKYCGDLQVCNPEPATGGQVCNEDLLKNDSERTSGTSVQVCRGASGNAQDERMKVIDRFFKEHLDGAGRSAEISYASREQLVDYVSEIADKLKINRDVAFRSVMQYGKDRNWI